MAARTGRNVVMVSLLAGGSAAAGYFLAKTKGSGASEPELESLLRRTIEIQRSADSHESAAARAQRKHHEQRASDRPWNYNWDNRQPEMLVKPPRKSKSPEQTAAATAEWEKKVKEAQSKVTRRIVLIRHGQYEDRATNDEERVLTPLGREQADLTGQRLRLLLDHFRSLNRDENGSEKPLELKLTMSTMTRARETAQIILEHLPDIPTEESYLLREGAPIEPEPPLSQTIWNPEPHAFYQEGARIEAAFRRFVHRASPRQDREAVDVIVGHGNVIRYFVCRALQLPPDAWLRLGVHNASITVLNVRPSGRVSLASLGEISHVPPEKATFN